MAKLDKFTRAYIECMLWAETDDDEASLDENYTEADLAPEALTEICEDCKAFQEEHSGAIAEHLSRAGHDFYLTRNRHGAGFWDGDWPADVGRELTDAAHVYGTQGLYVGDDGRLYTHG